MVNVRSGAGRTFRFSRAVASALAVILMVSLVFAPAAYAEGNSMEFKASVEGVDSSKKIFWDAEERIFALSSSVAFEGKVLADATLYLTPEALILESVTLLGKAYGVNFARYAENLAASVFAPDSGSAFAMDEETYARMQGGFEDMVTTNIGDKDMASLQAMIEELAQPLEELAPYVREPFNNLYTNLMDAAEITMKNRDLQTPNGAVAAATVTVTFGPEALGKAASQYLRDLESSVEAKPALAQILDILKENGVLTLEEDMAHLTGTELVEAVWAQLPQLADEAVRAFEGVSISFTTSGDKITGEGIGMGAALTVDGETLSLDLTRVDGCYGLTMDVPGEGQSAAWFVSTDNGDDSIQWALLLQEDGEDLMRVTLHMDGGEYTLTIVDNANETVLNGRVLTAPGSKVITLDTVDGEVIGETSLTLRDDDSVTVPEYTELLTVSEEELTHQMGDLLMAWASIPGAQILQDCFQFFVN